MGAKQPHELIVWKKHETLLLIDQEVKNFIANNCTEITTREDFQRYYRLMKEKFIESKFSPTSEKMKP